jgi:NodT family efflux transporter outer membrane factor (OMF) lipoprotein
MSKFNRFARDSALACAALLLASCTVGPDYTRPTMQLPASFKEAPGWKPAAPADDTARGPWWTVFGDPELDALEAQVDVSNQSLRAALASYDQAMAATRQARAAYYPTVSASAGAVRARSSNNVTATADSLLVNASWEADIWGAVRRSVEAAEASAQVSRATLEGTRLSLQAQLAQNYFTLRIVEAQIRMYDETVAAYARAVELTRNRYKAGVVTRADVSAAESQLASAQASRADAGIARAQLEHSIAVLTGRAPAEFSLPQRGALPSAQPLPQIPALLPAQLLERRPDIAAAERRAAAANAQIGVTQAAWYPTLSIAASGGYRGGSLADLISVPNQIWSIGPALAGVIFDGGARSAATDAARAGFDAAAAQYRQTVLAALQEVEDNLAALRILAEEAAFQREAVRAGRDALDAANNQYKAGTVSFANVIVAQALLLNAQISELAIRNRQMAANVTLIRALGGGWNAAGPT